MRRLPLLRESPAAVLQVGDICLCGVPLQPGDMVRAVGTTCGKRWPPGTHEVGAKSRQLKDVVGFWGPTWGYPAACQGFEVILVQHSSALLEPAGQL